MEEKQNHKHWRELRCTACRALLGLEYLFAGRLQIKCPRCGELNTIFFKVPKNLLPKLIMEDSKINKEELLGGDSNAKK
jgi:phage FluMu protein Com